MKKYYIAVVSAMELMPDQKVYLCSVNDSLLNQIGKEYTVIYSDTSIFVYGMIDIFMPEFCTFVNKIHLRIIAARMRKHYPNIEVEIRIYYG